MNNKQNVYDQKNLNIDNNSVIHVSMLISQKAGVKTPFFHETKMRSSNMTCFQFQFSVSDLRSQRIFVTFKWFLILRTKKPKMSTCINNFIQHTSFCILSLIITLTIIFNSLKVQNIGMDRIWSLTDYNGTNPLDGCVFVYLDMGTNIGLQIRLEYLTKD